MRLIEAKELDAAGGSGAGTATGDEEAARDRDHDREGPPFVDVVELPGRHRRNLVNLEEIRGRVSCVPDTSLDVEVSPPIHPGDPDDRRGGLGEVTHDLRRAGQRVELLDRVDVVVDVGDIEPVTAGEEDLAVVNETSQAIAALADGTDHLPVGISRPVALDRVRVLLVTGTAGHADLIVDDHSRAPRPRLVHVRSLAPGVRLEVVDLEQVGVLVCLLFTRVAAHHPHLVVVDDTSRTGHWHRQIGEEPHDVSRSTARIVTQYHLTRLRELQVVVLEGLRIIRIADPADDVDVAVVVDAARVRPRHHEGLQLLPGSPILGGAERRRGLGRRGVLPPRAIVGARAQQGDHDHETGSRSCQRNLAHRLLLC